MALPRSRAAADPPHRPSPSPFLAGAVIGMTILTMAAGAMALGTTLAVGQAALPK